METTGTLLYIVAKEAKPHADVLCLRKSALHKSNWGPVHKNQDNFETVQIMFLTGISLLSTPSPWMRSFIRSWFLKKIWHAVSKISLFECTGPDRPVLPKEKHTHTSNVSQLSYWEQFFHQFLYKLAEWVQFLLNQLWLLTHGRRWTANQCLPSTLHFWIIFAPEKQIIDCKIKNISLF